MKLMVEEALNESKGISDIELLEKRKKRFADMVSARDTFENDPVFSRDTFDKQTEARRFYDNDGKLVVNLPLENNLLEVSTGRQADKLIFDIEPIGEVNIEQTMPAKYAIQYYLEKEDFHTEKKNFEYSKGKTGTGIYYTGLTCKKETKYKIKEGIELDPDDIWNPSNYDEYTEEQRLFAPKNVPLRAFWLDDKAIYQNDLQKAEDCFQKERISLEEATLRYKDKKGYKRQDTTSTTPDSHPVSGKDAVTSNDGVDIYYYYNKLTKDFDIIVNMDYILFRGKMLYSNGRLPFESAQHYPRDNAFYGIGICQKIGYLKAYKSELLQYMLDGASISSGINMIVGDGTMLNGKTEAGKVNIWQSTGDISQTQQVRLDSNAAQLSGLLQFLDDLVVQDIGENIKAPYSSPASTLGEVEIMEENKAIRLKTVDMARDICLDNALTDMLQNIQDFAPALLKEIEKDENGNIIKVTRPKIQIKDVSMKKRGGKTIIEEDYGKYGFFELKPETIMGDMVVKVTTPNTGDKFLKSIKIKKYTDFIGNYSQLLNALPDEQKLDLLKSYPLTDVVEYMKDTFQVGESLIAKTKKSKTREDNLKKIEMLREITTPEALSPNPANVQPVQETPMPGMGGAQEEVATTQPGAGESEIGL